MENTNLNYSNKLKELSNEIFELKQEISKACVIKFDSNSDARLLCLNSIQLNLLGAAFWIQASHTIQINNTKKGHLDVEGYLNAVGSSSTAHQTECAMFELIKNGLLVLNDFHFETLIKSLNQYLNPNDKKEDISKIIADLCNKIGISDISNAVKAFKAYASIRNSLHNASVFSKEDSTLVVNGKEFRFKKGGNVQHFSIDDILYLTRQCFLVIREILKSSLFQIISEEVPLFSPIKK